MPKKTDWNRWLEHWDTWNAMVAEIKPSECGLYGCDEKVKVRGKWKCVACGKITTVAQELGIMDTGKRPAAFLDQGVFDTGKPKRRR